MIFSEVFKKLFVSCQVRNSFDLDHDKMIPHPDRSKTDINGKQEEIWCKSNLQTCQSISALYYKNAYDILAVTTSVLMLLDAMHVTS